MLDSLKFKDWGLLSPIPLTFIAPPFFKRFLLNSPYIPVLIPSNTNY